MTVGLPLDVFEGLQVDEPVTADHSAETSRPQIDDMPAESLFDEPIREDALVGAVPHLAPAVAAPETGRSDWRRSAVQPFRAWHCPGCLRSTWPHLSLTRQADGHFASPVPADSGRRRLLPRRSRSDEPAGPSDVALAGTDDARPSCSCR